MRNKRESTVEKRFRLAVEADGGLCLKFVSPGRRGVPDRLVLRGAEAAARRYTDIMWGEHVAVTKPDLRLARNMLAAALQFVELKAPGERAEAAQLREHARLRKLGFRVDVIDA